MDRPLLDFFIYFARHMVLSFLVIGLAWVLLSRWGRVRAGLSSVSPTVWRRGAFSLSLGSLLIFTGIGVWYLLQDGFASEVEPLVSSLSWLVQSGNPLYHDLESAQRYSVLYGPSVFLTNGLFLKVLGPSLITVKLASMLGVFGGLLFLYAALARSSRDLIGLAVAGLAALYFLSQGLSVFLVRPDALLVFAVGLGLLATVKARRVLAMVTLAVAIGFAVNLKAHAGVYFLPLLSLLAQRFGWRSLLPVLVGSLMVVGAPFFFHPQVSLINYLAWIRNAMDHGLITDTIGATLQYSAYLLLPLAVLYTVSPVRTEQFRKHSAYHWALGLALILTLVLAMKPGAGLVHLLPLVPSVMYLTGLVLREVVEMRAWSRIATGKGFRQGAVAAIVLTTLLTGSVTGYRAVRYFDWRLGQYPDLSADLAGILEQFPDLPVGMACGGVNGFTLSTWLRPLLVFADNPLLVDHISVMDFQLAGLEVPTETYRALESGVVKMWLVPRGQQPFNICNGYAPHDPVFSDRFVKHFESLYSPHGNSRYFDLWIWDGMEKAKAEPRIFADGGMGLNELLAP